MVYRGSAAEVEEGNVRVEKLNVFFSKHQFKEDDRSHVVLIVCIYLTLHFFAEKVTSFIPHFNAYKEIKSGKCYYRLKTELNIKNHTSCLQIP
jgi:hypothetical protein